MILKFYEYFIHVLKFADTNGKTSGTEIRARVLQNTGATEADKLIETSKGTNVANSRVYWAVQYLFQSGALSRPSRGVYEITPLGLEFLKKYPNGFTQTELEETEGYKSWAEKSNPKLKSKIEKENNLDGKTPQESIDSTLTTLEDNLARTLVNQLQTMSPVFLERTVLKLLCAMGYGFDEDSLKHTGGPGDEGIDGSINLDKLGVQKILVQAKRYKSESTVGRETLQAFGGSIGGGVGGIFITTSGFTKGALDYVKENKDKKIHLIDGPELGKLMQEYEIGVIVKRNYKLMEIDENFFYED